MTFDGITIAYYAVVCGALAVLAPRVRSGLQRIILGAGVGVIAATLFPTLRGMTGM